MVYVFPVFMNCRGKFLRYSLLFLNNDIESRKTEASLQFSLNSQFCTVDCCEDYQMSILKVKYEI